MKGMFPGTAEQVIPGCPVLPVSGNCAGCSGDESE